MLFYLKLANFLNNREMILDSSLILLFKVGSFELGQQYLKLYELLSNVSKSCDQEFQN